MAVTMSSPPPCTALLVDNIVNDGDDPAGGKPWEEFAQARLAMPDECPEPERADDGEAGHANVFVQQIKGRRRITRQRSVDELATDDLMQNCEQQ
jgi:hypothetical protein